MLKHLRYLRYLTRHRWFVFLASCKLGVPWLGLIHDLSKFRPSEWFPYAEHFYGADGARNREASREGKPDVTDDQRFDHAVRLHYQRNKHHWQYWVRPVGADDHLDMSLRRHGGPFLMGRYVVQAMPEKYRREMIADWIGVGRAISGRRDWRPWYAANAQRLVVDPGTRAWIERLAGVDGDGEE